MDGSIINLSIKTNDHTEIIERNEKNKMVLEEIENIERNEKSKMVLEETEKLQKNNELVTKMDENIETDVITCCHCNNKIYIEKNCIEKLNGVNIKCPYIFCSKYFFMSLCPKCNIYNKIPKFISEGDLIECLNKSTCRYQYLQSHCVIAGCLDIMYFSKPKVFLNSPNGLLYNHKNILLYQKISCFYCYRPIDFITKEANNINRYFDSMQTKCPYTDCGKCFNRIICSICSAINIFKKGTFIMGHKIKCFKCHKYFSKILCPRCSKINPLEKHFFKYGEFECRFKSCSKITSMANCVHCLRLNYFNLINKTSLIAGQTIICGYPDCKKEFSTVVCPSCHEINPFPNGGVILGKLYKCKYSAICNKYFQILVCPQCWSYSRSFEEIEGKKYNCNKCNKLIINFGCPFCNVSIMGIDTSFIHGQLIKCPSPECSKKFSFCRCFECKRLIYSEENKSIVGKSVFCNYCKNNSVNIICTHCRAKISFSNRMDDLTFGERVNCPNCNTDFEYEKLQKNDKGELIDLDLDENVYTKNLSYLRKIEGLKMNFGIPQVDENFLETQKIFYKHKSYNLLQNNNSKLNISSDDTEMLPSSEELNKSKIEEQQNLIRNKLCLLCQSSDKESIFFPCGHRCACYKCAVYFFEIHKKCPKCDSKADCIIPKIYNA